jgi:uncharacterized protein (DUF2249 family)
MANVMQGSTSQGSTSQGSTSQGSTSQAIYDRHQILFHGLLEQLKVLEERGDVDRLATFLSGQLLPQVFGEEAYVYPSLRDSGTATDTMSVDHEFIEIYVRRIEQAVATFQRATVGEQPGVRQDILRLGHQLVAILELHLSKEDHIYLPRLEHVLSGDREGALGGGDASAGPARRSRAVEVKDMVDVRGLASTARQARTFAAFGALSPGEAFLLVSDCDPVPLYYQLTFEYHGQLAWDVLERGPDTWRVVIGKGTDETR